MTVALAALVAACGGADTATTTAAPSSTTVAEPVTTTTTAPRATTAVEPGRLEAYVESWSEANEQGVILLVAPADGEAQIHTAGFADPEAGTAIQPDDVFYVGSITKTVVSTVMLQLVEEGLVALDATVDTYLPDVLAGEEVTVRHLLSHTSGIFNFTDDPGFATALLSDPFKEILPRDVVEGALERDRMFKPGERFAYSNTNYEIAGFIVEAVTGNPLREELDARVFTPLAMDGAHLAGDPGPAVVNGYTDLDDDYRLDATAPYLDSTLYTVAWGAGGLAATAAELATFASGAFEGELLTSATVESMTSVAESESESESEFGYGLGVGVEPLGDETVWGHGGGIPGYLSQFYYFPEDGLVMVALTNGDRVGVTLFLQTAAGIVRDG